MHRDFKKILTAWRTHPLRMPLIVRGARQVGKTFIIEAFGRKNFQNVVTINFETEPAYLQAFTAMKPRSIIMQLELVCKQAIVPGNTLLFLDEIQQCPKALQSLRYFKEQLPELHIIAAGSLLEFAIHEEGFSFPVGRVEFAKLYPLSFGEFLDATGNSALREALASFDLSHPPPQAIHEHCLNKLKDYYVIGGMPASVVAFLNAHSYLDVKRMQKALWEAFENDFGKYAKHTQFRYLKKVYEEAPKLIGSHVKYNRIDPDLPNPSREMKRAIDLLRLAGLVHPVFATSANSPLAVATKSSIFKLLFLDIGLVEQLLDIDPQYAGFMTGPLAEQFVGQELLASSDAILDSRLFFWVREKTNSSAEVDYLCVHKNVVYPIEVKAGRAGKLRSLHIFLREKQAPFGIKISRDPLGWDDRILSVPLYMVAHLPRLIESAQAQKKND